jgi:hypothetical protein
MKIHIRKRNSAIHIRKDGSISASGDAANRLLIALTPSERLRENLKQGIGSPEFEQMMREALAARGDDGVEGVK